MPFSGHKHTAESKAKIAASVKATFAAGDAATRIGAKLRGRKRPSEVIDKMRAAAVGRKRSDEAIAKQKASKEGKKYPAVAAAKKRWWAAMSPEERRTRVMKTARLARVVSPTKLEYIVETTLRMANVAFTSQAIVGSYIVDYVVGELVIECDGEYWHRRTHARDAEKDEWLRLNGYEVLRLSEKDILSGAYVKAIAGVILGVDFAAPSREVVDDRPRDRKKPSPTRGVKRTADANAKTSASLKRYHLERKTKGMKVLAEQLVHA